MFKIGDRVILKKLYPGIVPLSAFSETFSNKIGTVVPYSGIVNLAGYYKIKLDEDILWWDEMENYAWAEYQLELYEEPITLNLDELKETYSI